MASHPYISGPRNITQMIGYLRKNFPAAVSSETVKKLGLASNNESYVINALQFIGLIDEQGKRTDTGQTVMAKHDEEEFRSSFQTLIKTAYHDLFDLRGDDAWSLTRDQLIAYFRNSDKTSDIIGGRQAAVFLAFRELAGYSTETPAATKPKAAATAKQKLTVKKGRPLEQKPFDENERDLEKDSKIHSKHDMALTVRIEINLPAEGTQETYDAIFKSIRANLFP